MSLPLLGVRYLEAQRPAPLFHATAKRGYLCVTDCYVAVDGVSAA